MGHRVLGTRPGTLAKLKENQASQQTILRPHNEQQHSKLSGERSMTEGTSGNLFYRSDQFKDLKNGGGGESVVKERKRPKITLTSKKVTLRNGVVAWNGLEELAWNMLVPRPQR